MNRRKQYNKQPNMMKRYFFYGLMAAVASVMVTACNETTDHTYIGPNYVQLSAANATTILARDETPIKVGLLTAKTPGQDETLDFELVNNTDGILRVLNTPLILKAGTKTDTLQVVSTHNEDFSEPAVVTLRLKSSTDPEMQQWGDGVRITVNPNPTVASLTAEQRALIEGYKEKYGLNLYNIIGERKCTVDVTYPDDEVGTAVTNQKTEHFTSSSVITLSDAATADRPILKMSYNPFGLNAFLYRIFQVEGPEDENTWKTEESAYASILKLIGYDLSKETFSATLDNVELHPSDHSVSFTAQLPNAYGDIITRIPFDYSYSAWNRMQQKADEGATFEVDENGTMVQYDLSTYINDYYVTLNPANYLGTSDISSDQWSNDPSDYIEPSATYDTSKGEMTFQFPWDHVNYSYGYTQIKVTYQLGK